MNNVQKNAPKMDTATSEAPSPPIDAGNGKSDANARTKPSVCPPAKSAIPGHWPLTRTAREKAARERSCSGEAG